MSTAADLIRARLEKMPPEKVAALDEHLAEIYARPWLPTPGPQLEAFRSKADLLLYGGAAGGGKTDLICGLALTEHWRTVVFRRLAVDLQGFWDRLTELCPAPAEQNGNIKRLVTPDGRLIECGHLDKPGAERSWQGRPHDFIAFDEGAQLSAAKVNFVMGWNRSADGHRCRAVIATNPPMGGDGLWLIEWFAPWLDELYPNRAEPGELRWCVTLGKGEELWTLWVDGPEPVIVQDGKVVRLATPEEIAADERREDLYDPHSRTFIPSSLNDNPHLKNTGYRARINAMPEPMRSQLLFGKFLADTEDHEWQVIPGEWIEAAMQRWEERKKHGRKPGPMDAIGVDVAQGGPDRTTLAPLRGSFFEEIQAVPGVSTKDGAAVGALVIKTRRDGAWIAIDGTGGWGGDTAGFLRREAEIQEVSLVVFSDGSNESAKESRMPFYNLRAEMYWQFREALNPESGEDVALPRSARLKAQLAAVRWEPRGNRILIESKDEIRARLGHSPDEADAVVMAWHVRKKGVRARVNRQTARQQPVREWNPLEDW
jgi:hypothetical protein